MMQRRTNKWWAIALALGLVLSACGDGESEQTVDNSDDENQPTNEDYLPPLEDLDTLTDGAPDNEELPELAKSDEVFPAQFDLVEYQSPVRSQGSRGVCSIFSAVALAESLYIKEGTITDPNFSEQYLQWLVKTDDHSIRSFQNSSGSSATYNLQGFSRYGVVEEGVWPYESRPWTSADDEACQGDNQPYRCHTNGAPSEEVRNAPHFKLPSSRWVSTRERDIKAHMYHNRTGVVVGGDFYYQAWNHGASTLPTNQEYYRQGYVLFPNEDDIQASQENRAGHSILLVGWDDDLEVERLDGEGNVKLDDDGEPITEKGFFIFKNSWGTGRFGVNNPYGDGYGYISYEYVRRYKSGRASAPPEPHHFPEEEVLECADDELECDGECVVEDELNCGGCGIECGEGQMCSQSQCVELGEPEWESFTYEGGTQTIPDNDPEGLTTEIVVDGTGIVQGLDVDVFIEHTWNGDLQIDLIHPSGQSTMLREADGSSGNDVIETFSTDAFNGLDSEGTWQLKVSDHAAADEGDLIDWDLWILR